MGRKVDNKIAMTYEKLFRLKFKKGYTTSDLIEKFPSQAAKVREIALLQIPTSVLRKTLSEPDILEKILNLKRRFLGRGNEG